MADILLNIFTAARDVTTLRAQVEEIDRALAAVPEKADADGYGPWFHELPLVAVRNALVALINYQPALARGLPPQGDAARVLH